MTRWPVKPLTFSKKNPSRANGRSTYIHPPSLAKIRQRTSEYIGNKHTNKRCSNYSMILIYSFYYLFIYSFTYFWGCLEVVVAVMMSITISRTFTDTYPTFSCGFYILVLSISWKSNYCLMHGIMQLYVTLSISLLYQQQAYLAAIISLSASHITCPLTL